MKNRNRTFILALIVGLHFTIWGQDVIELSGIGNRTIEPAFRMVDNPKIIDTTITTKVIDYPLMAIQRATKITVLPIEPASIKTESKLETLYNTYVKLGIGSKLMPLGEIYFDSKRSRKFLYGAHVKHLSSFGNIPDYAPAQFDRTKIGLYGCINQTKYTLKSDFHYNNQGLHYYGRKLMPPLKTEDIEPRTVAQRYQDLGGSIQFHSHKKDSASLQYKVAGSYNHFNSLKPLADTLSEWRAKENTFAFLSGLIYKGNKEVYTLDFNVRHNGYSYGIPGDTATMATDSGFIRKNTILNLRPSIATYLKNNRFKAEIGVDLAMDASDKNRFYVYPKAELKYSMFNAIFIPYVGVRGGIRQTTFKSIANRNEFILPNVNLRNVNHRYDVYGGIKGTLSRRMSFNLGASFAYIENMAFFVMDTLFSRNKFNVVYDSLNLATIEGSLSYQIGEKLKLDALGKFYSYELKNEEYAWNMPLWEFTIRGTYDLYKKVTLTADVHFEGRRMAVFYEDSLYQDIKKTFAVAKTEDLGLIADVNLGLEYRYNKRISAFIQFNNIASQPYRRWYNYPVQRFQVLGGITARF
jgi:hypothetical protein